MNSSLTTGQTLRWTLAPLLTMFVLQRLYLQLVRIQHLHAGGYLIHHLFIGCVVVILAAFCLAFGLHGPWQTRLTLATLGIGSAMVLDEVTYLVATGASDTDYRSSVSLWGAIVLISLVTLFLVGLYRFQSCCVAKRNGGSPSAASPS